MQSVLGENVVAEIVGSGNVFDPGVTYGARIEVPVTRAIATAWTPASLTDSTFHVTLESPVAAGDYQLVWMDNFGANQVFVPLVVVASAVSGADWPETSRDEIRPAVDEVAVLTPTRTVNAAGDEVDTFDDTTRPTADQVEQLIELAMDAVLVQLPTSRFNDLHYPTVRNTVAMQAAVLLEGAFYKEKLDERSVDLYTRMINGNLISLNKAIIAEAAIGTGREDGASIVRIG